MANQYQSYGFFRHPIFGTHYELVLSCELTRLVQKLPDLLRVQIDESAAGCVWSALLDPQGNISNIKRLSSGSSSQASAPNGSWCGGTCTEAPSPVTAEPGALVALALGMAAGDAAVAKLVRSGLQVPHYWIASIFMQYLHSSGAYIPFVISCLPFAAKRCRL